MKNTGHRVLLGTLLFAGLVNGTSSYAKRLEPQLTKGEPFKAARSQLLRDGWKPRRVKVDGVEYLSIEKSLQRNGFLEVEMCSVDRPFCIFNYAQPGRCLRVITSGEKIKDLVVENWSSDCPDPEPSAAK